ncbi:MAG: hypothetical protein HY233_01095 [Acidobacteriales bacterium]|nr:hypothetical protein [Terriglobales bacterium]
MPQDWTVRRFLEACVQRRPQPEISVLADTVSRERMGSHDPERKYTGAGYLAFCEQRESALRLLRASVEGNYCAYPAMDTDPLFAHLREDSEFGKIRSAAIECRNRFLARRSN